MKSFSPDDIRAPSWDSHVRDRSSLYFGDGEITAKEISDCIRFSARTLGAKNTKYIDVDGWSYFCSDIDWLFRSEFPVKTVRQVFDGPCPFPEACRANSFRCEALCLPFSTDAFTMSGKTFDILKGNPPSACELATHRNKIGDWARIVGYKFKPSA